MRAMYFPALFSGLRRLGRWLVYELFQLALVAAFALHTIGSLRSALGGGGKNGRPGRAASPIKPKPWQPRPGRRPRLTYSPAA